MNVSFNLNIIVVIILNILIVFPEKPYVTQLSQKRQVLLETELRFLTRSITVGPQRSVCAGDLRFVLMSL